VEVTVTNGEVKLTGTVESRDAKRHAEDLVDSISGVLNVENGIRVKQEQTSTSGTGSTSKTGTGSTGSTSTSSTGTGTSNTGTTPLTNDTHGNNNDKNKRTSGALS
jgi:hypothetical protein